MGNVMRVWLRDLKRLAKTPAAWLVIVFLAALPSLYTWFNVAGFWNPYDNTGNLRICIVNEDEGAVAGSIGELHLGDQIASQLANNDQLGWAFMSRDEAREEVESGSAYAAFVIPRDFSANVATLLTGDLHQPTIEYYVNEKKGPVSPKITDAGANALDATINETFVSTVSEALTTLVDEKIAEGSIATAQAKSEVSTRIGEARSKVADVRRSIEGLSTSAEEARSMAADAKDKLAGANGQLDALATSIDQLTTLAGTANTSLTSFSARASTTLDSVSARLADMSAKTSAVAIADANAILAAKGDADAAIANARGLLRENDQLITQLEALKSSLPGIVDTSSLDTAIAKARDVSARADKELDGLEALSNDTAGMAEQIRSATSTTNDAVQSTLVSAGEFRTTLSESTIPALSNALAAIAKATSGLSGNASSQKALVKEATAALDELEGALDTTRTALGKTAGQLESIEGELGRMLTDFEALSASSAIESYLGTGDFDPEKIADFMMAPTQLVTEELYPLNAYGSAMAPLFINLTLWIGVFMLMVIMRLEVDDEGIERLTIVQRFLGRFLLLAPIVCVQAAICCAGCLYLGVQTANAVAFFATAIIASLSYLALQYTLSTMLQHVGKGICLILVFVQIPGASGLYPIEMTPDFFRMVYPLFPFTYGINAIRETISGFYGTTWISCIGMLAVFFAAFMLIGTLVRPYLTNLNRMFGREVAESDLIVSESVELPARRWRMSQVIRALTEREEFRDALESRVQSFIKIYPNLIGGAIFAGIAVPVITTAIMAAAGVDKVIILTSWLIWLVIVITYVVIVEFVRDNLAHQRSLESMDANDMRALFNVRNAFTRVKPLPSSPVGTIDNQGAEAEKEPPNLFRRPQ